MKRSNELKIQRNKLLEKCKSILDGAKSENRGLTEREKVEFDEAKETIELITYEIRENQLLEQTEQFQAEQFFRTREKQRARNNPWAIAARALHSGKTSKINENNILEFVQEERTLTSSTGSALIQDPVVSNDIIFNTLSQGYFDALGVDVFDLRENNYSLPKVTGYPTFGAYTESQNVSTSDATVGQVKFEVKNFGVIVQIHNNVVRDAGERTSRMLNGIFERAIQDLFLNKILHGSSSNNDFDGIDNVAGVATIDASSSTLTNYGKLTEAAKTVMANNASLNNIGFLMNPIVWQQLQDTADSTGQPLLMPKGLMERPMITSTAVKTDYGTGSNETRIYAGDWSTVKLGIDGRYEMLLDQRYAEQDVTGYMIVVRADLALFESNHMCMIQNIANS